MSVMKRYFVGCIAAVGLWSTCEAGSYPTKPVTLIVPFAAGGPTDSAARILAEGLQRHSKQQFIIENIGGAGSTLGATKAAQSQPDGYTLLFATSSAMVIAPHVYKNLRYDPSRSFVPIGRVTQTPLVLVSNSATGVGTLKELISIAKTRDSKLNYATPGNGTLQHVTIESLMGVTGMDAIHVPYRGGAPALMSLLQNDVQFLLESPSAVIQMVGTGQLRALAITGTDRIAELPDIPTLRELNIDGVDAYAWFGLFAPYGVSHDVLRALREMLDRVMLDRLVTDSMGKAGATVAPLGGEEFSKVMSEESHRFRDLIEKKLIKIE